MGECRINVEVEFEEPVALKKLLRQIRNDLEHKIIQQVLQSHHGNRKKTAAALGISYRALLYKLPLKHERKARGERNR